MPNFSKLIHLPSQARRTSLRLGPLAYKDQSSILIVKSEAILANVNHASERPDSGPAKLPPVHLNRCNSGERDRNLLTPPPTWRLQTPKHLSIHSRNISGQIPVESTSAGPSLSRLIYLKGQRYCGGFHSIRHGAASSLLTDGATSDFVQKQLRHSDARITLGIYGHVVGDAQRTAVQNRSTKLVN